MFENRKAPTDRVRAHTSDEWNERVSRDTRECLRHYATSDREEISRHINELNREWDIERMLQTNASVFALSGVLLGAAVSRKWLILPGAVFSFFLQHAVQGWCPPVPFLRRMGFRTRKEINREKYALKALRGDFEGVPAETRETAVRETAVRETAELVR
jgi:hypothetical protein